MKQKQLYTYVWNGQRCSSADEKHKTRLAIHKERHTLPKEKFMFCECDHAVIRHTPKCSIELCDCDEPKIDDE